MTQDSKRGKRGYIDSKRGHCGRRRGSGSASDLIRARREKDEEGQHQG